MLNDIGPALADVSVYKADQLFNMRCMCFWQCSKLNRNTTWYRDEGLSNRGRYCGITVWKALDEIRIRLEDEEDCKNNAICGGEQLIEIHTII
ncbi:hypothetical protein GSbR_05000 [Geobacter sp. SVR]|nr:hypothetical protein GSVR_09700 [Geobacter sp. SVR]GCF83900.1 hypothetical protein GSbR_05000 [Geobacter sp. SVR]